MFDISISEKERALEALLQTKGFSRSEQLRRFLEFITRNELEGHGDSITEYRIAVEAFGRPRDFSVEADSIVRSRAHELRRRIDDYYSGPGRNDPVRLFLPKGTYCPRFVRASHASATGVHEGVVDTASEAGGKAHLLRPRFVHGLAVGCLAMALIWWSSVLLSGWRMDNALETKLLRAAWGPILVADRPPAIVIANSVQLWVRQFTGVPTPMGDPPVLIPMPSNPRLLEWYRLNALREPIDLYLHPNAHSPLWGDAAAAIRTVSLLSRWSVAAELIPEQAIRPAALKERNVVLIGRGDYSEAVQAFTPADGFRVEYSAEHRAVVISKRKDAQGEARIYTRDPKTGGSLSYGLVTVITRDIHRSAQRMIILSGINSDGAHAGADFLTTPQRLAQLDEAFRKQNRKDWPRSFQVVVRTRSTNTFTMDCEYVDHYVLKE